MRASTPGSDDTRGGDHLLRGVGKGTEVEYQPVPSVGKRADPAVLEDILGITYDLTMEEPVIASHLPWQLYEVELDLMTKNGIKKLRITC